MGLKFLLGSFYKLIFLTKTIHFNYYLCVTIVYVNMLYTNNILLSTAQKTIFGMFSINKII